MGASSAWVGGGSLEVSNKRAEEAPTSEATTWDRRGTVELGGLGQKNIINKIGRESAACCREGGLSVPRGYSNMTEKET